MTNKELYQATFSQVHASRGVDLEEHRAMERKRRHSPKLAVSLAAVLVVLAALSTAAVAGNWLGLRELVLPEKQELRYPMDPETEINPVETVDIIGLSGWSDSPEAQALAEWQAFLNNFDPDGEIIAEIGNEPTGLEAEYGQYQVYTPEMANKLEEIVEKYGLKLHQICNVISHEELVRRVGGEFLGDGHGRYWAYIYEDGTFQFDGDVWMEEFDEITYQLRRSVKGTFDETVLNVIRVEDYREQSYETASGEAVLLALGAEKSLIFGDFPDCFVTVNVLAGTKQNFSMEDLKILADGIRFDVLKTVVTPEMTGDSEVPSLTAEEFEEAAGVSEAAAQAFYCQFYQAAEEGRREDAAALIDWPRLVRTADGETHTVMSAEEFLPLYDEVFTTGLLEDLSENQYTEERADLIPHDGMVSAGGGAVWFTSMEDGQLAVISVCSPDGGSLEAVDFTGIMAG